MAATPDSKAGLYAKMAAVMADMSNIPKTGTNSHFNYKFVTADAVADKVRELLAAKGVAFFASIVGRELMEVRKGSEKTDPKTGEITRLVTIAARWVVNFEFTFADSDSGATQTSTWTAEADSADDKGINKCATAAEKYFLLKTFIVSSADEPDADADGGKKRQQAPQNSRNGQPPPQQRSNTPAGNVVQAAGIVEPQRPNANGLNGSTGAGAQNDGGSAKADFFDDEAPPAVTASADGFKRYLVHEIVVNEMPNGGRQYVAKSEIGDNIVTYGGEAFQDAGFDTSKWAANSRPNKVDPAAIVEARQSPDKKKWEIRSVEVVG